MNRGHCAAGQRVRSLRLSPDHGAAPRRGLVREPQAGRTHLATGGTEGACKTTKEGPAMAQRWVSLPFIPSCLPTTARVSGTDIILSSRFCNRPWARSSQCFFRRIVPANLCKGMRMPAASTSPQRGIDRIRAGVVRPRGVRNDDADRRPWARKRPFRTRPAERVVHPVCPCRATSGSLNRDNSRGMSQECAANAAR